MEIQNGAQSRYEHLRPIREPFLKRARDYAKLTIPSLLPPEGHTGFQTLYQPYQGLGAKLVVNLASRIMTALLPPGQKHMVLQVPPTVLVAQGDMTVPPSIEKGLALSELLVHDEVERRHWRRPTFLALLQLIVAGNALEYQQPDNTIKAYRFDQYVVVRDPQGTPLEVVIEENFYPGSLPPAAQELAGTNTGNTQTVPVYTHIQKTDDGWFVYQEVSGQVIPGTDGIIEGPAPFNALRWADILGEDYGRGKVEEHFPDLMAFEALSKSMLDGSAMASRHILGVRPSASGGLNLQRRLSKAANGDVLVFNEGDVTMLQYANVPGLQIADTELQRRGEQLSSAFLMHSGQVRDAERVTATEHRMIAEELESTLGGVYSMLSQDMMRNRMIRLLFQMGKNGELPPWPDGMVEPMVTTGLEALGRQQDVIRVQSAAQILQGLPPEIATSYVKWDAMLTKAMNGLGLPDVIRDEAEAQQIMQQRAQEAAAQSIGPEVIKQAGAVAASSD